MTETKKSNGWSWQERQEIVREFHASGQTQRAFCRQWGISANTLRSWCQRLAAAPVGSDEADALPGQESARLLAVQVQADEPTGAQPGIALVTRAGMRIDVHPGFDAQTLQRLLALLGGVA